MTDTEKLVGQFLLSYNFPSKINGYQYVKDCIAHAINNQGFICNKVLFGHVAKKYNTDSSNIERCIRTFITKSWEDLASTGLFSKRPSCREFILKCAEYISFVPVDFTPASAYDILFV